MRKTRKVLSILCALAMLVSMFSAFSIVSAASDVGIVAEVVSDTTMTEDAGKVTYNFKLKGITSLSSVNFKVTVDPTYFTCTVEDVKIGTALAGGQPNPNYSESKGRATISWASATPATIDETSEIGSIILTVADGVTISNKITAEIQSGVEVIDGAQKIYGDDALDIASVVIDPAASSEPPVPVTKYTITKDTCVNGSVSTNVEEAAEGAVVTVTATPDAGYVLDTITVKDADGADVTVTDGKFTMPAKNVTVSATFKVAPVNYDVELDVNRESNKGPGDLITIKTTGEYADKFDIVVQVYYDNDTAVGFVVYDEVSLDTVNTIYVPSNCKVSVNAVDEIGDTNADLLGNLIAANVKK